MAALDASRRNRPVPRLALWSLGAGIVATVGSFEFLMVLIRKHRQVNAGQETGTADCIGPGLAQPGPPVVQLAPTLEQAVRDLYAAGHSQRSIARDLSLGRRRVKQIIDTPAVC